MQTNPPTSPSTVLATLALAALATGCASFYDLQTETTPMGFAVGTATWSSDLPLATEELLVECHSPLLLTPAGAVPTIGSCPNALAMSADAALVYAAIAGEPDLEMPNVGVSFFHPNLLGTVDGINMTPLSSLWDQSPGRVGLHAVFAVDPTTEFIEAPKGRFDQCLSGNVHLWYEVSDDAWGGVRVDTTVEFDGNVIRCSKGTVSNEVDPTMVEQWLEDGFSALAPSIEAGLDGSVPFKHQVCEVDLVAGELELQTRAHPDCSAPTGVVACPGCGL